MDMGFHVRYVGIIVNASVLLLIAFAICSVNGCSLKTEDNLLAAKVISPDKLLLETGEFAFPSLKRQVKVLTPLVTDAPWCSMTSTHASKRHLDTLPTSLRQLYLPPATKPEAFVRGKAVKSRNEPSAIGGVGWVIHRLHSSVSYEEVVNKAWKNTVELFGLHELE